MAVADERGLLGALHACDCAGCRYSTGEIAMSRSCARSKVVEFWCACCADIGAVAPSFLHREMFRPSFRPTHHTSPQDLAFSFATDPRASLYKSKVVKRICTECCTLYFSTILQFLVDPHRLCYDSCPSLIHTSIGLFAVAYRRYSKSYVADENFAKDNNLGLWAGSFISPEKWRKLN